MRMGQVCRLTMLFRRPLWPDGMSFLLTPEQMPPVWWTAHPEDSLTLTGWSGGPRSAELLVLNPQALQAQAIESIAAALSLAADEVRAELTGFYTHDWTADLSSRGAYSWVPVGGLDASAALSEPVEATLYFAGEHTGHNRPLGHSACSARQRPARRRTSA